MSCEVVRHLSAMQDFGLVANTLVHTPDGTVRIQDIRAGDVVLSQAEGQTQIVSRRVTQLHHRPTSFAVCVDFWKTIEGWETGERGGLLLHDRQRLWLRDEGWTSADDCWGDKRLECVDGGTCVWFSSAQLYRTDTEGVVWMDGFTGRADGGGLGRTFDLRDGSIRFDYPMVENPGCDISDGGWNFRPPMYGLQLEAGESYFVGDWGIRIEGAK